MKKIIKVKKISQQSTKKKILDEIDFEIKKGEIVGLLGHNGAGKTTILRRIAAREKPETGNVYLAGKKNNFNYRPQNLVLIPDENYLFSNLTILENAEIINIEQKVDYQYLTKHLENLGIDPTDQVEILSKGNREIAQLILYFSLKKEIFLLDEPLGSIDIFKRDYIIKLIIDLQQQGSTFVITTHLIREIEPVIDRVIYFHQSKIILDKTMEEIYQQTQMGLVDYLKTKFDYQGEI